MSEHKVLIPLDGSDFSLQAFRTLARLFEPETTKVTLVHVAPVPEGVPQPILEPIILGATSPWPHLPHKQTLFSSQEWESTRAEVLTAMDDDAQRLSEAGFEVTKVVRFGHPAQEIADMADEHGFDAVIMATHGRSGVSRTVMGSVAEKVLRMVLVPVVMVRPRPRKDATERSEPVEHWL